MNWNASLTFPLLGGDSWPPLVVAHSAAHGCSAVWSQGIWTPCLATQSSQGVLQQTGSESGLSLETGSASLLLIFVDWKTTEPTHLSPPLNGRSSIFNLPRWIKIVPFLRVTPSKLRPASVGAPKKLDGSRDDPRKLQIWSTVSAWWCQQPTVLTDAHTQESS